MTLSQMVNNLIPFRQGRKDQRKEVEGTLRDPTDFLPVER